jgi:hypothetical protein
MDSLPLAPALAQKQQLGFGNLTCRRLVNRFQAGHKGFALPPSKYFSHHFLTFSETIFATMNALDLG